MGSRLEKNSSAVRKRIEQHAFSDEMGEEYEGSAFGGFNDYFRRKKLKLQNLDTQLRNKSIKPQIFKGIVAHISGYTQPPLHVLHKELVEYGAGFIQYLDSKTMATHVIASSLTPKKSIEFKHYRIVKPAWVVDSIAAGKVLPWSNYRVIDEGSRQKLIKFGGGKLSSQINTPQRGYKEQTQNSFYTAQFKKSSASPATSVGSAPSTFKKLKSTGFIRSKVQLIESIEEDNYDEEVVDRLGEAELRTSSPAPAQQAQHDIIANEAVSQMRFDDPTVDEGAPQVEEQEPAPKKFEELPVTGTSATRSPSKKSMTSEEHNAWLLSDPRMRKSSTANPDFIRQYYAESRLHHLSTWKAELKSRMQRLANAKGLGSNKVIKRRPGSRRYVMHVDFDSFFCAVSLKSAPDFVNKPTVVAHGNGTGSEIASCNYPAREFGVQNGMWMKRALDLCPDLKILPYDFPGYEEASKLFYEAILEIGGVVQSVSIDEALVDITGLVLNSAGSDGHGVSEGSIWREQEKADRLAAQLRARILDKTGCNVSIGIGGNILLAKVALRRAKPAGQYQIRPEEALDFLGQLKVEHLPGVAYSIGGKLEEMGIKLVKDIRDTSKERLISVLGPKTGEKLWEYSKGIDRAEVGDQPVRKSVSAEVNWGIRFLNQEEAEEFVMSLCKELEKRLFNEGVKGKNLTVKIMRRSLDAPLDPAKHLGHGKCDTFNKSKVFGVAAYKAETIGREAVSILRFFKFSPGDLRGLGVQLQKLEPLKPTGAHDGSQRQLNFGAFGAVSAVSPARKVESNGADDISDFGSPGQLKHTDHPVRGQITKDPIIEDPITPQKPRQRFMHPALALARAYEVDEKATTPLNMMGTQFVMPNFTDAAVLAELPPDIHTKLMAQQSRRTSSGSVSRESSPVSRDQSPALAADEIPPDIDPGVFNALPEEVQAELRATFGSRPEEAPQPHSPRKDMMNMRAQPKSSPSKRGRGGLRGALSRHREIQRDAQAGRVQTNFVTAVGRAEVEDADEAFELDPAFLTELPEGVQREILEDHRRRKLAHTAGLGVNLQAPDRRGAPKMPKETLEDEQATIDFPKAPVRTWFTATTLTSEQEVKDMLMSWHRQTRDHGPHRNDVVVFDKYLAFLVSDERDMGKARKMVKWLACIIEADEEARPGGVQKGMQDWSGILASANKAVQRAVKARGLGTMAS